MTFYDDAELVALQVVRECAEEAYSADARSAKIASEVVVPFFERHGSDGMHALVIALGRLSANTWSAVLQQRLGHFPSRDEILAELDSFEMHKLGQHQADEGDL